MCKACCDSEKCEHRNAPPASRDAAMPERRETVPTPTSPVPPKADDRIRAGGLRMRGYPENSEDEELNELPRVPPAHWIHRVPR
jgi:hypothetical protein